MDMNSYQDEQDSTVSCFKLECGHAYHTRCIVNCLQRVNRICPNCNTQKPPEQILRFEGVVSQLVDEAKRSKEMRPELNEYKTSYKQLQDTIKQLKNDTKQYIQTRKEELEFNQKKRLFSSSLRKVRTKFTKICKIKGPLYYGAYKNIPPWRRERIIFSNRYRFYRLKHPYICLKV